MIILKECIENKETLYVTMIEMRYVGFTLAELLIALAILGVIATFTIPKVLNSQQDQQMEAIGQETAAMVSAAFQAYQLNNTLSASTNITDLTPFFNYVSIDTTSTYDTVYNGTGAQTCGNAANDYCLRLHNGALFNYHNNTSFGGTNTTNGLWFALDPDGRVTETGSPFNGRGKQVVFWLYFNGRITTEEHCPAGTSASNWTPATCPETSSNPDWFSW